MKLEKLNMGLRIGIVVILILTAIIASIPVEYFVSGEQTISDNKVVNTTEISDSHVSNGAKSNNNAKIKIQDLKNKEVPDGDTDFQSFMDADTITDPTSKQYQLKKRYWQSGNGLYRIDEFYVVAMTTYYGDVGDKLLITLDTGMQYPVIIGDIKNPSETDNKNQFHYAAYGKQNVVEFIVDSSCLPEYIKNTGNIGSYYDEFSGNIVSIEKYI